MAALRPWFLLCALAALVGVAGCGGGSASPFVAPPAGSAATTIPIPAATATSAVIPVPGASPVTVTIPPVSGAPAGSTISISASTTRPATLPSAVPQSPVYVTLTLPSGATMSSPASLAASGGSQFGFGPVAPTAPVTQLGRTRVAAVTTPIPANFEIVYDPAKPSLVGYVYEQTQVYGYYTGEYAFTPSAYSVVPGSSTLLALQTTPGDPVTYAAVVPASVAPNVTFSTSSAPCTPYLPGGYVCQSFSLGLTGPVDPFPIIVINTTYGYGDLATIYPAAAKTSSYAFGNFNEFPAFNASGPVPLLPNTFTLADLSLPAVSPATSASPLTITTSVTPLDQSLGYQIALLFPKNYVAAVNFSYPQDLTFGAVGNLSSDFCFPSQSSTPTYAVYAYVGTTYNELKPTVASQDATCPTGIHLSVPSNFGTAKIPANTNFGLVIVTPRDPGQAGF